MSFARRVFTAAVFAAAFAVPAMAGLTVTAIDHAGFLFSDGKTKILVDALLEPTEWPFSTPSAALLSKMENGEAPFDAITLLLVSHNHNDHFVPGATLKFLIANPKAMLVTTPEVRADLAKQPGFDMVAARVMAPDLAWKEARTVTVNGVTLELDRLRHGDNGKWACENDAFVFTLGGKKVLFATATDGHFPEEYKDLGYAGRGFDLAFFNAGMAIKTAKADAPASLKPDGVAQLKDLVAAKTTVLMHFATKDVASIAAVWPELEKSLPGVTRFGKELESRTY